MAFARQSSAGSSEIGLAILRIGTGATLFLRHGWEKQPMHWAQFFAHFPDPVHIGSRPSFLIAFVSDFVCSLLLVLGVATRWAALFCFCNILVAWALVHRFAFFGRGAGEHGEVIVLYLVALLTLVLAGSSALSLSSLRGR